MAAFTTRAKIKTQLGIPTGVTQHDQRIDDILDSVDAEMFGLLRQTAITSTVYNETYDIDGPGDSAIALRHWPATSIAAVTDAGSLVAATDYYIDPESKSYLKLSSRSAFFTQGRQQVNVTYTAGHATVPGDLTHAGTLLAVHRINTGGHAGFVGESAGGYRYSLASGGAAYYPPAVQAIIARYRPLFSRP